ncbi:MAG: hypothetical protein JSS78_09815 [Bacteroidetes bacterium]|nr:hypothetical protein [Bacteroidota bacterium]
MRALIFGALLLSSVSSTFAQESIASATASQTVQLVLNPSIDLRFSETSTNNGSLVSLNFSTIHNYSTGVVSGVQELEVRSNKNFKISVQTDAAHFSYNGVSGNMPVANTLFMAVTGNSTGGTLTTGLGAYKSLSAMSSDVVLNGSFGDGKKLAFAYKAKPSEDFPPGVYSVGVLYTATQP